MTQHMRKKIVRRLPSQLSLGNINLEYIRVRADMEICEDLVDIARGVLSKDIELEWNTTYDKAYTNGVKISIPQMHTHRRLLAKHELAHIYFNSDLDLRLRFAEEIVDRLVPLSPNREDLIRSVCYLINIFDDVRVNSLWSEVWPGDGWRMRRFFVHETGKDTLAKVRRENRLFGSIKLSNYLILRCLEQDIECEWNRFDDKIEDALEKVPLQSFKGLLAVIRNLMEDLVEGVRLEMERDELERNLSKGELHRDLGTGAEDQSTLEVLLSGDPTESTLAALKEIFGLSDEDIAEYLDNQQDESFNLLEEIQEAIDNLRGEKKESKVDYIVREIHLKPEDCEPTEWTPEMRREAEKWSTLFRSIVGAKRDCLFPEGERIDHHDYVIANLCKMDIPFYHTESTGVGFEAVVLADMSGSMEDSFDQVNRLFMVLRKALSLPFVKLDVVGFCGTRNRPTLVNFGDKPTGLIPKNPALVWSLTPTDRAIEQMKSRFGNFTAERHLFILTDGLPSGGEESEVFTGYYRQGIQDMGVHVHTLIIGSYANADDEKLDKMFGPAQWTRTGEEDIYSNAFHYLTSAFMNYVSRVH